MNGYLHYHSLENDFLLFDWRTVSLEHLAAMQDKWGIIAQTLCDRKQSIGADGVLVLTQPDRNESPRATIWNADGSPGELCLNGLRCIADYLYTRNGYAKSFDLLMASKKITCTISDQDTEKPFITMQIPGGKYLDKTTVHITLKDGNKASFTGHQVNIGNPHFIIFAPTTPEWLVENGALLSTHETFPNQTNVEFVWHTSKDPLTFSLLPYERGCGFTRACSSGAAATILALHHRGMAPLDQDIAIKMPGGTLNCLLDSKNNLFLEATATYLGRKTVENSPFFTDLFKQIQQSTTL